MATSVGTVELLEISDTSILFSEDNYIIDVYINSKTILYLASEKISAPLGQGKYKPKCVSHSLIP